MASFAQYESETRYRFDGGVHPQTGDLVIVKTTLIGPSDGPLFVVGFVAEAPDTCRDKDEVVLINGRTRTLP